MPSLPWRLLPLLLLQTTLQAAVIPVVTTEFPPFQSAQPAPWGVALQAAQSVAAANGDRLDIRFLPWPRAYQIAETTPDVMIFCLARTAQRETRYGWIGQVAPNEVSLWRLRRRHDVQPATLEQARRWQLGVTAQDMKARYLLQHGFVYGDNLQESSDDLSNIRKLYAGRIDLLPFSNRSVLFYQTRLAGLDPAQLVPVLALPELSSPLYLAFSPGSNAGRSARYAATFSRLNRQGLLARLNRQWQLPHDDSNSANSGNYKP